MSTNQDLTPDQMTLIADPAQAGTGYDDLTQLQMLVDRGYLRRSQDGTRYERTEKGEVLVAM